jgi:hypothetical protein
MSAALDASGDQFAKRAVESLPANPFAQESERGDKSFAIEVTITLRDPVTVRQATEQPAATAPAAAKNESSDLHAKAEAN